MVWTSDVIPHSFRGVRSHEDRARMSNLSRNRFIITSHDLDMLRCKFVHDGTSFIQGLDEDDRAETAARIRTGPAPLNLQVPEYQFVSDTVVQIG